MALAASGVWPAYADDSLSPWQTAAVVALSFAMAILSWRFVELPFRKRAGVLPQKPLFTGAAIAMCCFAAFGLFGHFSRGWPDRVPSQVFQIAEVAWSDPRVGSCLSTPSSLIRPKDACEYGAKVSPTSAVWGDSHADALIEMIGELAKRHAQSVKFLSQDGCPPIAGVGVLGYDAKDCYSQNEQTINYILRETNLHTIILISRWSLYVEGYNQ